MSQQTQVDRVIPKFESFMAAWPTIEALANAETSELLAVWSGLGYNSRALRLRESARIVTDTGWPDSPEGLAGLPGVGPYTAAAVASIAFGEPVPAVDTNLKRVLGRWLGEPIGGAALDSWASEVLGSPAGDWNEALMDLGSMICTPRGPRCGDCPVAEWCIDPSVYEPPARQVRFEGSHRQLRGALVRASVAGDDLATTGRGLGRSIEETDRTVAELQAEGLIPDVARQALP